MDNYSCSEIRSYNAHQLFANAYYDFVNDSRWTPYAGAGIGWARTNLDYWNMFVRKPEVDRLRRPVDDRDRLRLDRPRLGRREGTLGHVRQPQ